MLVQMPMSQHRRIAIVSAILLSLAAAAPAADVPYISGGVGADDRAELQAREGEYNLKVIAAESSGDFLSGVAIAIERGKQRVFETTMDGPILLVKLPPGTYTIRATSGRDTLTQTVTVPAQGLRQAAFTWRASR